MVPARSRPASPRAPVAVAARVAARMQPTSCVCAAGIGRALNFEYIAKSIDTDTPPSAPPRPRACTTRCTIRDGWRGVLNRIFLSNHNAIVACTATCDRPHSIRRVQAQHCMQHHLNLRLPCFLAIHCTIESSNALHGHGHHHKCMHVCLCDYMAMVLNCSTANTRVPAGSTQSTVLLR